MQVTLLKNVNIFPVPKTMGSLGYAEAGQVIDVDDDMAAAMIAGGEAEAVAAPVVEPEPAPKAKAGK